MTMFTLRFFLLAEVTCPPQNMFTLDILINEHCTLINFWTFSPWPVSPYLEVCTVFCFAFIYFQLFSPVVHLIRSHTPAAKHVYSRHPNKRTLYAYYWIFVSTRCLLIGPSVLIKYWQLTPDVKVQNLETINWK